LTAPQRSTVVRVYELQGAPPTQPVKTHLEHIYQKLDATDRTAAVAEALRRRLIE
jgi:hypothetical protein